MTATNTNNITNLLINNQLELITNNNLKILTELDSQNEMISNNQSSLNNISNTTKKNKKELCNFKQNVVSYYGWKLLGFASLLNPFKYIYSETTEGERKQERGGEKELITPDGLVKNNQQKTENKTNDGDKIYNSDVLLNFKSIYHTSRLIDVELSKQINELENNIIVVDSITNNIIKNQKQINKLFH